MNPILLVVAFITLSALHFWFFKRKHIYRATVLDRDELNRMHRHTAFAALFCLAMFLTGWWFPGVRLQFVLAAALMLFFVLPLRTLMIEKGIRYRRPGTLQQTPDPFERYNSG